MTAAGDDGQRNLASLGDITPQALCEWFPQWRIRGRRHVGAVHQRANRHSECLLTPCEARMAASAAKRKSSCVLIA
jgi:hypothetical protein